MSGGEKIWWSGFILLLICSYFLFRFGFFQQLEAKFQPVPPVAQFVLAEQRNILDSLYWHNDSLRIRLNNLDTFRKLQTVQKDQLNQSVQIIRSIK